MALIDPMDFEKIFINVFAGDINIFVILTIILITIIGAYLRLSDKIILSLLLLFVIIFADYLGILYVFIILVLGLVIFYWFARLFNS